MDYWVMGNPFNFGRLRATLHYKRDEHGAVAESKADVILEAPCSTVEAIDKLASTKQWLLKYELLRPALRNGKIFVTCYITILSDLMTIFVEVLNEIEAVCTLSIDKMASAKPLSS